MDVDLQLLEETVTWTLNSKKRREEKRRETLPLSVFETVRTTQPPFRLFPRLSSPNSTILGLCSAFDLTLSVSHAMAVTSENAAGIDVSVTTDPSPSGLASDVASQSSSTARPSLSADTPDRNDSANSSPNLNKDAEAQVLLNSIPQTSVCMYVWNLVELFLCLVSKKRSGNEGK
jgi:hypothetical protein